MKCQILFPGKNKKTISKCCLLKILPRVLSVNFCDFLFAILHMNTLLKWVYSKGKEIAPLGSKFFLSRTFFKRWAKTTLKE